MDKYSIGEISKEVGLPTKTIRFYEEEGLILNVSRSENGYRQYPKSAIDELKLVKYARDLGLPLTEIKKLVKGCEGKPCRHTRKYLLENITSYLDLLKIKIGQMQILEEKLMNFRKDLESSKDCGKNGPYCCDILHQLLSENQIRG